MAAIWLFYILEKLYLDKILHFSRIYYHTPFQGPILSGIRAIATLQVRSSAMLLLLVPGN
jgi:hypothetical protein